MPKDPKIKSQSVFKTNLSPKIHKTWL